MGDDNNHDATPSPYPNAEGGALGVPRSGGGRRGRGQGTEVGLAGALVTARRVHPAAGLGLRPPGEALAGLHSWSQSPIDPLEYDQIERLELGAGILVVVVRSPPDGPEDPSHR